MEFVSNTTNNLRIYPLNDNYSKSGTMNSTIHNSRLNIIKIDKRLDVSTSQKAKQEILDKMAFYDNIIIDMSRCEHISNYGIYLLSMIMNKAKLLNVKVVFISIMDEISELLSLTGIIDKMASAPSVEAAVRKYALN